MTSIRTRFFTRPALVAAALTVGVGLLSLGEAERASEAGTSSFKDAAEFLLFALYVTSPLLLCRQWIMGRRARLPKYPALLRGGEDSALGHDSEIGKASAPAVPEDMVGQNADSSLPNAADKGAYARYLATASHELRQPLQAMKIFMDALRATPLSADQSRILSRVEQSHESLGNLITTLLDISKINAGSVKPRAVTTGLHHLFGRLEAEVAPLMMQKNLQLRIFMPRRNPALRTDPDLLLTILRNLLGNAAKYTDRGGVLLAARSRKHHLAIQVWDTGIGIDAEHLPHIYTEFFRIADIHHDHTEGFGLGLSIVKRLVQLLDYDLDCRSRKGRGTVFEIRIPMVEAACATPTPHHQERGRAGLSPADSEHVRHVRKAREPSES